MNELQVNSGPADNESGREEVSVQSAFGRLNAGGLTIPRFILISESTRRGSKKRRAVGPEFCKHFDYLSEKLPVSTLPNKFALWMRTAGFRARIFVPFQSTDAGGPTPTAHSWHCAFEIRYLCSGDMVRSYTSPCV